MNEMLFRRPNIWDKPITLFTVDGITVHIVQSRDSTHTIFKATYGAEKLLIPLKGSVEFMDIYANEKDIIYIPRRYSDVELSYERGSVIYLIEVVSNSDFEPYVKRFSEARYIDVGDGLSRRRRYILIDVNDRSEKFLAGFTECCSGCWGSYPPHRHDDKYEVFVYYGSEHGFGIQLLIDEDIQEAYIVRDFDVFLVKYGYHPNVSIPSTRLNYLWVMISVKGARDFSMHIHPMFSEDRKHK
ncbi:MAG: 5-deoxy-glucuronate isomerase [Ignisphaera sp.]